MSTGTLNWQSTVFSEVNPDFVSDPFPVHCQCIRISVRICRDAPVEQVWIRGICDGVSFRILTDRTEPRGAFDYYQAEVEMEGPELRYWFEISSDDDYHYYDSLGMHRNPPAEQHDFVILADLSYPDWIPGSVCYQIFPDRFRAADPDAGVASGEYQFDGAEPQVIPWGEDPPEFEQGRCLDFYNGDLKGIEASVPYLQDLHVDVLYLNPVFAARTNHRYDCIDYFQVDQHLGGDAALISMAERLHESAMFLILDVSINHTGTAHPWFQEASHDPGSAYADFYYRLPGGSFAYWAGVPTLAQLNYGCDRLRKLIWEDEDALVRRYLKHPFFIDGWRFDVANEVGRRGSDQFCHEIWQEVRKAVKHEQRHAYILGEHWEDPSSYLCGDQWDSAMNYFGSGRPLRRWMGERDRFLLDAWGHSPEVSRRKMPGSELYEAFSQHLSQLPNQLQFLQYNLIDSHDTPRLHHHAAIWDWDLYRGTIMMLFSLPGAVSYLYGDEIGIRGHADSVEGSRYPMEWDRDLWDMRFYALYRDLGRIRTEYRQVFAYGAFAALSSGEDYLCTVRFLGDKAVVTILNRSEEQTRLEIPIGLIGAVDCTSLLQQVPAEIEDGHLRISLERGESAMLLCSCDL